MQKKEIVLNENLDGAFTSLKDLTEHLKDKNLEKSELEILMRKAKEVHDKFQKEGDVPTVTRLPAHYRPLLSAPFPEKAITDIQGNGAKLSTVKSAYVYERLNTVFGILGWSVEWEFIGVLTYNRAKKTGDKKYENQLTQVAAAAGRIRIHEYNLVTPIVWATDELNTPGANDFDSIMKGLPTSIVSKAAGNYLEVGIQIFKGQKDSKAINYASRFEEKKESNDKQTVDNVIDHQEKGEAHVKHDGDAAPQTARKSEFNIEEHKNVETFVSLFQDRNKLWDWFTVCFGDPTKYPVRSSKDGMINQLALLSWLSKEQKWAYTQEFLKSFNVSDELCQKYGILTIAQAEPVEEKKSETKATKPNAGRKKPAETKKESEPVVDEKNEGEDEFEGSSGDFSSFEDEQDEKAGIIPPKVKVHNDLFKNWNYLAYDKATVANKDLKSKLQAKVDAGGQGADACAKMISIVPQRAIDINLELMIPDVRNLYASCINDLLSNTGPEYKKFRVSCEEIIQGYVDQLTTTAQKSSESIFKSRCNLITNWLYAIKVFKEMKQTLYIEVTDSSN
jgi:hypothetical protein